MDQVAADCPWLVSVCHLFYEPGSGRARVRRAAITGLSNNCNLAYLRVHLVRGDSCNVGPGSALSYRSPDLASELTHPTLVQFRLRDSASVDLCVDHKLDGAASGKQLNADAAS